ncbi:MAG: hypothetical protein JNM80_04870 [Phycisphaerae bacterium]|nr:hypothetical protein [Phycisphaerae bacterium]
MNRELLAPTAIGLAVCVGGYMMAVQPAAERVSAARMEVAALERDVREGEAALAQMPELTRAAREARVQAATIEEHSRFARDERALLATVSSVAAYHGVELEHVAVDRTDPDATPSNAGPLASAGLSLTARGDYSAMIPFFRALRTDLGFAAVVSVRLTPLPEPGRVRAEVRLHHFGFDTSPEPASDPGRTP